jgi:hypothetical protein
LDAVVLDTTVQALSGLGAEQGLLLAARGDTVDARVIVRFDALPETFVEGADPAKPITFVDSATLRLLLDTLSIKANSPVTIEAYDVDTTANDTSSAAVLALFRPDRLVASQAFVRSELKDTVNFALPGSFVLAKTQNRQPLRVGLRAVSASSTQILIHSTEAAKPPLLRFRVSPDTAIQPFSLTPFSKTPSDDETAASNLADYTVFNRRPPPAGASELALGGFPPLQALFRFDIPTGILDSSTIIRATLLLNRVPHGDLDPDDSVFVITSVVMAGTAVTDPTKAAQIFTDVGIDILRTTAGESGPAMIELGRAFLLWRSLDASETPRAIVLRARDEGTSTLEVRFSSVEAAAALRPRLRISYTNEVPLGLP